MPRSFLIKKVVGLKQESSRSLATEDQNVTRNGQGTGSGAGNNNDVDSPCLMDRSSTECDQNHLRTEFNTGYKIDMDDKLKHGNKSKPLEEQVASVSNGNTSLTGFYGTSESRKISPKKVFSPHHQKLSSDVYYKMNHSSAKRCREEVMRVENCRMMRMNDDNCSRHHMGYQNEELHRHKVIKNARNMAEPRASIPQSSRCTSPNPSLSPLSPHSPVSPYHASSPISMCLPYTHSTCKAFHYTCHNYQYPETYFQRFPYYYPAPHPRSPTEIPHIPRRFGSISDESCIKNDESKYQARGPCYTTSDVGEGPKVKQSKKEHRPITVAAVTKITYDKSKLDGEDSKESKNRVTVISESTMQSDTVKDREENEADSDKKLAEMNWEKLKSTNSKTRKFTCKYCGKIYVSLGALKMHIRTHTLPCKCNICGKAFSRPWLLQGHIRTHTGEKPYKCNLCQRAFADRSNLRAHLQTHSDVKKYSCQSCGKTFSRMSLLIKHEEAGCLVL